MMKKDDKKLIAKKTNLEKFSNFVIFQTENGKVNIDVFFQDDTLWLTQKMMAELFEVNVPAISKHLKNIFESKELAEKAVVSILETTANDNKKYKKYLIFLFKLFLLNMLKLLKQNWQNRLRKLAVVHTFI